MSIQLLSTSQSRLAPSLTSEVMLPDVCLFESWVFLVSTPMLSIGEVGKKLTCGKKHRSVKSILRIPCLGAQEHFEVCVVESGLCASENDSLVRVSRISPIRRYLPQVAPALRLDQVSESLGLAACRSRLETAGGGT